MQPPYSDVPAMIPESRTAVSRARDGHQMPRDNIQGSRNRSAVAPMRSEGKIYSIFYLVPLFSTFSAASSPLFPSLILFTSTINNLSILENGLVLS